MAKLLAVGLGGFLGALARWGLASLAHRLLGPRFPHGTLAVNLLGCFLIGVVWTLIDERELFTPNVRLFLTIGFLGSLTTFSTFGHETIELMRTDQLKLALFNVALNVLLGFGAVLLGRFCVRFF